MGDVGGYIPDDAHRGEGSDLGIRDMFGNTLAQMTIDGDSVETLLRCFYMGLPLGSPNMRIIDAYLYKDEIDRLYYSDGECYPGGDA